MNDAGRDAQTREVTQALEAWKKGLLTVSGASRLVNYRPTKTRTLVIDGPSAAEIMQGLDDGLEWTFEGTRDDLDEESEIDSERVLTGIRADAAPALHTPRAHKELGPTLRTLMRTANAEWLDRGLHTLYLAFGMLHWRDVDDTQLTSPLLLVPVELQPIGPRGIPPLTASDEERVTNPALRVQLQRSGVELPTLDDPDLVSVDDYLDRVRDLVSEREGWSVSADVILSLFSFHKEAMYRDLVDNQDRIVEHPLVRALGTSDPLKQDGSLAFEPISPEDIDRLASPETTPLVLDADSSQRVAIAAATDGRSFVMDGPPGTGKSQTIANMIGALLHAGKTVLFVSEKAAALEVVRNRLEHVGLLPYLFELHSDKTSRKEVAVGLLKALESRPHARDEMGDRERAKAAQLREQLSEYATATNEIRQPLGESLHTILGRVSVLSGAPHVRVGTLSTSDLSRDHLARFPELMQELPRCWRPAEQRGSFLWKDVTRRTPLDEPLQQARRDLGELRDKMRALPEVADAFEAFAPRDAERLEELAQLQSRRPAGVDDAWLMGEDHTSLTRRLAQLRPTVAAIKQAEAAWAREVASPWEDAATLAPLIGAFGQYSRDGFVRPDRDARQLRDSAATGEQAADALQRIAASADRLAASMGLEPVGTAQDVERVIELARLTAAPHKPDRSWFAAGAEPQLRQSLRTLAEGQSALAQAEAEARPYFTDAALNAPVADLLERFTTLHRGWWNKLGSAYRADKRAVADLLGAEVPVAEGIRGLEKAVTWAQAHFNQSSREAEQAGKLGIHWQGRQTDFNAANSALDVVAHAAAVLHRPVPDALLDRLTSDSLPNLHGLAMDLRAEVDAYRAFFGQGLLEHQHLLIEPLATAQTWLRAQARSATDAAAELDVVDRVVGRVSTGAEARNYTSLWASVADARSTLESTAADDQDAFGEMYSGVETDFEAIDRALGWVAEVTGYVGGPLTPEQTAALRFGPRPGLIAAAKQAWDASASVIVDAFESERHPELHADLSDFEEADALLEDFIADPAGQDEWHRYTTLRGELAKLGLDAAVDECIDRQIHRDQVPLALEHALLRGWSNQVLAEDRRLRPDASQDKDSLVDLYREHDRSLVTSAHARIIQALNARRPEFLGMGEQGVIQREGMKKRRHIAVRELLAKTQSTVLSLKPCFMMSPLAVSTYLPPEIQFDVVIFDEASQITPSDAVNSIYRGKALILAGDDKQLPPTSFFEKLDDGDVEEETDVRDFESVLELAKASGALRNLPLRWHYRSADDALINFSNRRFYEGNLVVFPGRGDQQGTPAVTLHKVDGIYRRGTSRDNPIEADAVAKRVLDHFTHSPDETLGVVTFSVAQASAVLDALDRARETRRDLDEYFDVNERLNAFFVKSLESVQGDERDKIIFSIGYGPDENGKKTTNFGVLNRDKGWRRLNVAVTRARSRIEVVSSVRAGELPPSSNENVEHLRAYLDYAERGMPALMTNLGSTDAEPESPFEESVIQVLTNWGYTIEPQVGSAGYRIDIGVRHPDYPGLFMLGVECDGYQYHSALVARDRDRLRQQVLERIGWQLHRIWGTAWYRDRAGEEARLRQALEDAAAGRLRAAPTEPRSAATLEFEEVEKAERPGWATEYVEADVPDLPWRIDVSEMDADMYMVPGVRAVIEAETPVHTDVLFQRLRDAWGIGRVGSKIRANIMSAVKRAGATRDGDFVMVRGQTSGVRTPSARTTRKVEQIHSIELAEALSQLLREMGSASDDELRTATARLFGWGRTGNGIQARLDPIIRKLVTEGRLQRRDGLLVNGDA